MKHSQQTVAIESQSYGSLLKRITFGFLIYVLLDNFVNQTTMILLAIYIPKSFSTSPMIYSLTGMLYNLGKLLMMIPLAKISEKIGKRKTLLLSFSFTIWAILLMFLSSSLWLILLGRFLMGMNAFAGITFALIDDFYTDQTRGKPVSWFSATLLSGFLLGSLLGGNIHSWLGDTYSFLFLLGITILTWGIIFATISDHPQKKFPSQHILKKKRHSAPELVSVSKPKKKSLLRKSLFTNRTFVGTLLINFSLNILFLGAGVYWSFMIINHYQIPANIAGLFFLPPLIGDIGAFIYTGTRKDMPRIFKKHTVASIFSLSLIFIFPFWNTIGVFTVCGVIFGFINCSMIQANDTMSFSVIPNELKDEALGIYKLMTVASGIIGPLLFGLLSEYVWIFAPIVLFPLMTILSGVLYKYIVQPTQAKNI